MTTDTTTPAVERAAEALNDIACWECTDNPEPGCPNCARGRKYEARRVLAAALDVEEIARAMVTAVLGDGWWNADGPIADSVRSNNRALARAARAAILGEEATA